MQKIKLRVNTSPNSVQLSPSEIRIINAVSPTVDVERTEDGAEITVHDVRGAQSVEIYDGEKGNPGRDGADGQPGRDGQDGFSPTVDVTEIEGGHRVTITDAQGEHAFDVMDGSAGVHVVEYSVEGEEPTLVDATYDDIAGWLANNELVVLYSASAAKAYYLSHIALGQFIFLGVDGDIFLVKSDDTCEIIESRYAREDDVGSEFENVYSELEQKYSKPSTGIPATDLASSVQTSLGNADTAYQKPSTGIPSTDLASTVQTSLSNADTAYQKPSTGIPASDLASGVIPPVPVQDVQVNGTSVLGAGGVANVPVMSTTQFGVAKIKANRGILIDTDGTLKTGYAGTSDCKSGVSNYLVVTPGFQHSSIFYGLAKAAGDATQSASSNAVGTYTDAAKVAIQKMLGVYREWELIADYTVLENTTQLDITTDTNGQPFALSNMLVRAWLEPATTGDDSYIGSNVLIVRDDNEDVAEGAPKEKYMENGAKTFFEYTVDLMCGVCRCTGASASGPNSTSALERFSSRYDNSKYIRGFRLKRFNDTSTLIPAGSNIKIYGIRI